MIPIKGQSQRGHSCRYNIEISETAHTLYRCWEVLSLLSKYTIHTTHKNTHHSLIMLFIYVPVLVAVRNF